MNFSNSRVFRISSSISDNHISGTTQRPHGDSTGGGKVNSVVVKGAGQTGVQSEWIGTTWFRRLVQKDSRFELEQVRYVVQSVPKCR